MQDIGGCRAVLSSCTNVYKLAALYRGKQHKKFAHQLVGQGKDYITTPKPDGYRSIHLIFRWVGPSTNPAWDKLRIEMQITSIDQHAWATALETVDILTRQALKANQGDERWKRFFALASSMIAFKEKTPLVPGTPDDITELRRELAYLARELNVIDFLQGFRTGIQAIHNQKAATNTAYYLLHLSVQDKKINWTPYGWHESQAANASYTALEQQIKDKPGDHVVLVKAGSLSAIKRSYPSFFLDTGRFVDLLLEAMGPVHVVPPPKAVP